MDDLEQTLRGMTVNERLGTLGLFDAFDHAVASGDMAQVIAVLKQARLTQEQAEQTAATVLAHPQRYGFDPR